MTAGLTTHPGVWTLKTDINLNLQTWLNNTLSLKRNLTSRKVKLSLNGMSQQQKLEEKLNAVAAQPSAYVFFTCTPSIIHVSFSLCFLQRFYCWPSSMLILSLSPHIVRMHTLAIFNMVQFYKSYLQIRMNLVICNFLSLSLRLGGSFSWKARQGFMREIWSGRPVNMRYVEIL